MVRFSVHEIGIAQGNVMVVSDFDTQGPMWTGQGPRLSRHPVVFSERFVAPPVVQLAPVMWDLDGARNSRGDMGAENVTPAGFDIVFRTWGDTRIARLRVQWTAIGPVPDDEDFLL